MGKSSDLINTICKFLIALLFIMIFLPPFFRFTYPDTKSESSNNSVQENKYLSCKMVESVSNASFSESVIARYSDNKFSDIKYTFVFDETLDDTILNGSKIFLDYKDLKVDFEKSNSNITSKEFKFNVKNNVYISQLLNSYKKSNFDDQKRINMEKGFDCSESK